MFFGIPFFTQRINTRSYWRSILFIYSSIELRIGSNQISIKVIDFKEKHSHTVWRDFIQAFIQNSSNIYRNKKTIVQLMINIQILKSYTKVKSTSFQKRSRFRSSNYPASPYYSVAEFPLTWLNYLPCQFCVGQIHFGKRCREQKRQRNNNSFAQQI